MLDATVGEVDLLANTGEPAELYSEALHGQVRSLYAMLRFYAEDFVRVYRIMGGMQNLLQRISNDDMANEDYTLLTNLVNHLSIHLSPLNVGISLEMTKRFLKHCEDRYPARAISEELRQLFTIIESELKSILFVQIPKHRQGYYELVGSNLNESVLQNLSLIVSDLEEGLKCFALGRNTACVFHLMRVMEISVQILGKKLKVKLVEEQSWHNIIDEVNKAIKNMNPKTTRRKTLQREYATIASHLFSVKVAWRNPVMHPKASYTEEEAEDVLRSVVTFINHLAATLK